MLEREQLIREIGQSPDSVVKEVLNFLLFIKTKNKADDLDTSIVPNPESPYFLNFIDEMNSETTAADDNTPLPRDLSKNIDHYLYGSPKEEE
jgi:hypothetical protein